MNKFVFLFRALPLRSESAYSSMCITLNQKFYCKYKTNNFLDLQNYSTKINSDSPNIYNLDYVSDLFKNINYRDIVGDDEELLKRLKVLMLEVEVMRQDGSKVPSEIKTERWKELLNASSRSQRLKLLNFLYLTEKRKIKDKHKKELKKLEKAKKLEEMDKKRLLNDHLEYGFQGSTIFLRVYDKTMDKLFNSRLFTAMLFGQNLVVDLSYDEYMTPKEASNCAKQLTTVFAYNRLHKDPFNLHFCNADPQSKVITKLKSFIPPLYEPDFPLNISEHSYLDLFPKEKLVYLTPHCRQDLLTYNHDDIYIIGGMVDKMNNDPLSLAKAKKQGLRMAKLPLDKYLIWCLGSKSLTLDQVLSIMLDMKVTGDWMKAFVHVPKRKLADISKITKGPPAYRRRILQMKKLF